MSTYDMAKNGSGAPYVVAMAHLGRTLKEDEILTWEPATVILKSGEKIKIPLMRCDTAGDVMLNVSALAHQVGDKS